MDEIPSILDADIIPRKTAKVNTTIVEEGYEFTGHLKRKSKINIGFDMVGNGNKNSFNYSRELLNMSRPEAFMFQLLLDNRNVPDFTKEHKKSNHCDLRDIELTSTQKQYIVKAYKILREKDLVVRTKSQRYLINPRLVISHPDFFEDELNDYNRYTKEK